MTHETETKRLAPELLFAALEEQLALGRSRIVFQCSSDFQQFFIQNFLYGFVFRAEGKFLVQSVGQKADEAVFFIKGDIPE